MATRTYENFDLTIETVAPGRYRARVLDSPTGDRPTVDFQIPLDPNALKVLVLLLDPGRSGTRRGNASPSVQACRDLGSALYESIFTGPVAVAWSRSEDAVISRREGLRLRLRLDEAPDLAGLPWESMYDRSTNSYVAQSDRTPLVRFVHLQRSLAPHALGGALRVLAVLSSPTDQDDLDIDAEWDRLTTALAPRIGAGQVVLDRLPEPTLEALSRWLRTHDVNVLHFVGHGDFDQRMQEGVLLFCDTYGQSAPVTASMLGPFVHDHDPLRLVVLNACRTADGSTTDPYSGMAQGLAQQDAAAVVAMQFPISDKAAIAFTEDFYGSLADGQPVDQAVTTARKTLNAGYGIEWVTPVLFMRTPDGQVFTDLVAQPTEAIPVRPPVEPARTAAEPARTAAEPARTAPAPSRTEPTVSITALRTERLPLPRRPVDQGPVQPRPALGRPVPSPHRPRRLVPVVLGALLALGGVGGYLAFGRDGTPAPIGSSTAGSTATVPTGTAAGNTAPAPTPPTPARVPGPTVQAARFGTPPIIDGDGSEWEGHRAYVADHVIARRGSQPPVTATWQLGWDPTRYYLFVRVVDPSLTQIWQDQPAQVFNGDSVSFELGQVQPAPRTDLLPAEDSHVLFGPDPSVPAGVLRARNVPRGGVFVAGAPFTDADAVSSLTPDGYTIEAAVPWTDLHVTDPHSGLALLTNLDVSDAVASGRDRGLFSTMSSNNAARTDNSAQLRYRWGELRLTD